MLISRKLMALRMTARAYIYVLYVLFNGEKPDAIAIYKKQMGREYIKTKRKTDLWIFFFVITAIVVALWSAIFGLAKLLPESKQSGERPQAGASQGGKIDASGTTQSGGVQAVPPAGDVGLGKSNSKSPDAKLPAPPPIAKNTVIVRLVDDRNIVLDRQVKELLANELSRKGYAVRDGACGECEFELRISAAITMPGGAATTGEVKKADVVLGISEFSRSSTPLKLPLKATAQMVVSPVDNKDAPSVIHEAAATIIQNVAKSIPPARN